MNNNTGIWVSCVVVQRVTVSYGPGYRVSGLCMAALVTQATPQYTTSGLLDTQSINEWTIHMRHIWDSWIEKVVILQQQKNRACNAVICFQSYFRSVLYMIFCTVLSVYCFFILNSIFFTILKIRCTVYSIIQTLNTLAIDSNIKFLTLILFWYCCTVFLLL